MAHKLIILLHNIRYDDVEAWGTPFFQATVAAAMQYDVEIILSGRNVQLAQLGTAKTYFVNQEHTKTIYDYMLEAVDAGAAIKVCAPPASLERQLMVPEIQEVVGTAYVVSEMMDVDTVTLTY